MKKIASDSELWELIRGYHEVHLFLGYGERAQYANVEEVLQALHPSLRRIENKCHGKPFLAIYGGDKAVEERPDLGWLMKQVQERYNCHILAIQSAGVPDAHVDFSFVCEQQFEKAKRTGPDGQEHEVDEVLYGGTRNGVPVGGSRYYLGAQLIKPSSHGGKRLLTCCWVMGGGGVALDEVKYADEQAVPWVYVPSRARNEAAYKSTYGPVHEWVIKRMSESGPQGKVSLLVSGN
eukprot:CAMPEP_0202891296 /NCGR_PEP_ID=MMETSP1392-20130828/1391_1 /ASSEMBLY_ACC=CAM_ASM_000868 /TAXON_ID=225041 /ORGANISM="Chlamydomonas chlamydogama, Strain SAG 11-48b" /LENGTH=234 /DNA_ID=CAMNT_0049575001 /DNA_START=12 /DNA_END=716 /DNA_ORIENTATION=-